jgi:hypothetical protein
MLGTLWSEVIFIFFVSETCAPLGMGRLGTQPFEVSETFSTPGHFKLLLAQGTILLKGGGVQLEPADFCVDNIVLIIIGAVSVEVYCNPPIIELACTFKHGEELGMQPCKYPSEPLGQWSGWHVI